MNNRSQLVEAELETLFIVSKELNSSFDLHTKLHNILETLHNQQHLLSGMITLRSASDDNLRICEVYAEEIDKSVRYTPGEGLVGTILDAGSTIVVERLADEPRFLSRLGLYNPELAFIGSPILIDDSEIVGVLTIQPANCEYLGEKARFLEMVANLIAQSVKTLHIQEKKEQALLTDNTFAKNHSALA